MDIGHLISQTLALTAVAMSLLFGAGCASIVIGPRQKFKIDSDPQGAIVSFNGESIGTTPFEGPVLRAEKAKIVISKDGYETAEVEKSAKMNPWVAGNLVSFFIPGAIFDIMTGAFYKFKDPVVNVTLREKHLPDLEFLEQMLDSGAMTKTQFREQIMMLHRNGRIDEANMRKVFERHQAD